MDYVLLSGLALDVAFQPIVDLTTGAVFGFEALGRARTLHGAPVPIRPLLERARAAGQLLSLDRTLRRRAIERIAEFRAPMDHRWFLNVDSRCVDDPAFSPGYTRRLLEQFGLEGLPVVIELGEHDPALDRRRLNALYPSYARQGFEMALDDFGAAHATLERLVELRPGFVKIDAGLVHGAALDPMRRALLRALATFAREAGIVLVAEGLERPADLSVVLEAGIPLGQGFLLGRPAPLDVTAAAPDASVVRRWFPSASDERLAVPPLLVAR